MRLGEWQVDWTICVAGWTVAELVARVDEPHGRQRRLIIDRCRVLRADVECVVHVEGVAVARTPVQRDAAGNLVDFIEVVPAADILHRAGPVVALLPEVGSGNVRCATAVLDEAVLFLAQDRHLARHSPHLRQVDRGEAAHQIAAAHGEVLLQAEFAARLAGDQVDRPPGGVASVQGTLRPAQHLDALRVGEIEQRALRTGNIVAVDIHADRTVGGDLHRVGDALAAHVQDQDVRRWVGCLHQAGYGADDVTEVVDALPLHGHAGEGGDCDRHLLQVFLALLRRHHDLFDPALSQHGSDQCRRGAHRNRAAQQRGGKE